MTMRHVWRRIFPLRRGCSERSQAVVEFALVGGIFFMLVFGIIDTARLFESWVTVQHAAREGARYALTGRSDCDIAPDNRLACIEYQAKQAAMGLSGGSGAVNVTVRKWAYPDYADPPVEGSAGVACDDIEVQVQYDHHFLTPVISAIVPDIQLSGRDRVINEPFGRCGQAN
jgi:Flp pilus assembly protein TadG